MLTVDNYQLFFCKIPISTIKQAKLCPAVKDMGLLHNVFIVNHIFPRRLLKWLRSRKVSCSFMTHTWWKYNFFHMHPSWHVKRLIIYIKNRTRCLHHLNRFILQSVNNKFQSADKITWRQNGFQKIIILLQCVGKAVWIIILKR